MTKRWAKAWERAQWLASAGNHDGDDYEARMDGCGRASVDRMAKFLFDDCFPCEAIVDAASLALDGARCEDLP